MNEPSQRGAFIAKLGAWLQVVPVLEIAARVIGITAELAARYSSGSGNSDRFAVMARCVHNCTTIAVSMALIGLSLITIAITVCHFRAKWLFEFLRFYGVLILGLSLVVEFGRFKINLYLPFGLFFLIYGLMKKDEFLRSAPIPAGGPQTHPHG